RVSSGPDLLVGDTVEVVVGRDAASDRDERRESGIEAAVVVPVEARLTVARARASLGGDAVAVLEVPDLVREGDVVRMRRPWDARVLARGRVPRVEAIRRLRASRSRRLEVERCEAVGRAGGPGA